MLDTLIWIAVGAVIATVVPYVFEWLDSKIANIRNEKIREALLELSDVVEAVVEAALDTDVKDARAANDGELPHDTAQHIKAAVIRKSISGVSKGNGRLLKRRFAQLDDKVGDLVEVSLDRIKERRGLRKKRRATRKAKS